MDMPQIVEKEITDNWYAEANNEYMKGYSLYFMYWKLNNFYGWAISQKLPVNNSEWEKTYLTLMRIS